MTWLRRIGRWVLLALAVAIPWVWALSERRARRRETARADQAEGALERDARLSHDLATSAAAASQAVRDMGAATERDAAPHDADARVSARHTEAVSGTDALSAELLEEIARRNNARLEATRRAAREPNPW